MKKNNKKGFTIVELVIVIAVIGILAAVLIPTFGNIIADANQAAAEQEAMNIYKQGYALDIMDGVINNSAPGDTAGSTITVSETVKGYSVSGNVASATATKGGKTATVTDGKLGG